MPRGNLLRGLDNHIQFSINPDQLLPQPLDPEPGRPSTAKKQEQLPDEPHAAARIVIVDPRRTVTVNACEVAAGKENVLHLAINSGTDLALFNAMLTYVADQGWLDQALHRRLDQRLRRGAGGEPHLARGRGGDLRRQRRGHRQGRHLDRRAEGGRRATAHDVRLREGPDLGQRQLPHQWRAGEHRTRHRQHRPRGRRLRAHGRTPGGLRPTVRWLHRPAGALRRQAADRGQGRRAPHLGLRPLQDDAERLGLQARLQRAHQQGQGGDGLGPRRRPRRAGRGDRRGDPRRRPLRRRRRHHPDQDRRGLPRAAAGRHRRAR